MERLAFASVLELAEAVAAVLVEHVRSKPSSVIGWPSGRSAAPALAALARRDDVDFTAATVLMMDEYATSGPEGIRDCPPDAHYSCRRWANEHWTGALGPRNMPQLMAPSATSPLEVEQVVEQLGGLDLFVIGIGASDAHVGFNPPGTPIDSRTRLIQLAESTRIDHMTTFSGFGDLAEVPTHGTTVGLATILEARQLVAVAHGLDKADVVQRTLASNRFDPDIPSTIIFAHDNSQLVTADLA